MIFVIVTFSLFGVFLIAASVFDNYTIRANRKLLDKQREESSMRIDKETNQQ
jgi:Na+-transporting NADH:ubiquinone oxidoreductase subunit NqrC